MRRFILTLVALAFAGAAIGLYITRPQVVPAEDIAGIEPDLERGALAFAAGGCASCHAAPGASGDAKLILAGGEKFETPFGTFVAPNISSDPAAGIGTWSIGDLVTAMKMGTSPGGQHYYPAFPYASYAKADLADLVSLAAYLKTLPADPTPSQPHELGFPFNIRATLGGWKLLALRDGWAVDVGDDATLQKGQALAEGLGHCGECHTPRNGLGIPDLAAWFGGAPNPSGKGRIPNITPGALQWSAEDIAIYLDTGFTPEFDSAGGTMADVVENMAKLAPEDRAAIAAYVKAVPAVANPEN